MSRFNPEDYPIDQASDEALIARVMRGEQPALSTLVERHHRLLLGYLYRMVNGDRALAEDLVQETFVRLLEQDSYRRGRPFKAWLYAIATNLARDHFRAAAIRRAESFDDATRPEVRDPAPNPEELSLSMDQGRAVAMAIGQLSEEYRVTVLLRFYNGLTLQEIADVLDVPLGTVKSRLSVGTKRLRELLRPVKEGT